MTEIDLSLWPRFLTVRMASALLRVYYPEVAVRPEALHAWPFTRRFRHSRRLVDVAELIAEAERRRAARRERLSLTRAKGGHRRDDPGE